MTKQISLRSLVDEAIKVSAEPKGEDAAIKDAHKKHSPEFGGGKPTTYPHPKEADKSHTKEFEGKFSKPKAPKEDELKLEGDAEGESDTSAVKDALKKHSPEYEGDEPKKYEIPEGNLDKRIEEVFNRMMERFGFVVTEGEDCGEELDEVSPHVNPMGRNFDMSRFRSEPKQEPTSSTTTTTTSTTDSSNKNESVTEESKFDKLSNELSHEKGIKDPDAVAASIGRKKYGKAGMAKKSAEGRK